ncbi:MAG: putative baseplate assembly protein [Proteobacteria bacterium]|nr:putative baseplate assembly protein [Pseudomonadota bacterium]
MIERKKTACGSSDGLSLELDRRHENRPSLPSLAYRLGRHGDFFARMVARLPIERGNGNSTQRPPLERLTYRGTDDATIAIVDACATLLDVLSFYQERIVDEAYIRTALERRSVLELARSIGYEMRPGVAASTLLAFTVEDSPDIPDIVTVPRGTQILSIPKKDETPKTYETTEAIEARSEWNSFAARVPWTVLKQMITSDMTSLFVSIGGTEISPGDLVLLVDKTDTGAGSAQDAYFVRQVQGVIDVPERDYSKILLQSATDPAEPVTLENPHLYAFRLRSNFFGHDAPDPVAQLVQQERIFTASITTPVRCVALLSGGKKAAIGYEAVPDPQDPPGPADRTLWLWNVEQPAEKLSIATYNTIEAAKFSPYGSYLAISEQTGNIQVWDAVTRALVAEPGNDDKPAVPAVTILFTYVGVHGDPPNADQANLIAIDHLGNATTWYFHPDNENLIKLETLPLGDFTTDPRIVRDGNRELEGRDDGSAVYRFPELDQPEPLPETIELTSGQVHVDAIQANLVPQSWALLADPDQIKAYPVTEISVVEPEENYGLSGRVTRLTVDLGEQSDDPPEFSRRQTDIYADSIELAFAELDVALPEPVEGDRLTVADTGLDGAIIAGLVDRTVVIQGRPAGNRVAVSQSSPDPARFPITAILPDEQLIALTVEKKKADEEPWRLFDENGLTFELGTDDPNLYAWNDGEDIIQEAARVKGTSASSLELIFAEPLQYVYDWRTVRILSNVAPATHGETTEEVLGSGDGLVSNQRFRLKNPPITYVPASSASGSASTLEVRVNGVLWQERDSLLMAEPGDEVYVVRMQDDGKTEITTGDGRRGARLPTGAENVVATYRSGIGPEGELDGGQLALLQTSPLGLSEVVNPLPATGAAAAESESETRENAPRTVLVLGRVVSVQDYQDFTRSFPGVGKAQALGMWDGITKFVHLTVGTETGHPIVANSPLYTTLQGGLDAVRDTNQLVKIDGFDDIYFGLCAKVLIDERYLADNVLADIRQHVAERFSYHARTFGQDVTAAEIVAAMHEIAGVVAVDLDALYEVEAGKPIGAGDTAATQRLSAELARFETPADEPDKRVLKPAQLLLVDSKHIDVSQMP